MRTFRFITTTVTATAAALIVTGCSGSDTSHDSSHDSSHDTGHSTSSQTATDHNQADVTYAQGMTMHHQQAVEMSDIVLDKSGVDPDVTQLAKEIKKAQGPEITTMQGWLEDWGEDSGGHGEHGSDMSMDGMVSAEDITQLKQADGPTASKLFLDQMIEHHQGAVEMAEQHRKDGKDPEALTLSKTVITDQKAEIKDMRTMRAGL